MSSVSKMSSRSSSSGFSSFTNDRFLPTLILQTVLDIQRADINVRTIFCGEQDCQLNELRQMTGAIIDLNIVPGTRRAFERVNWTISHHNSEVRDFVVRRLNYWMQQTQLACDMIHEDGLFLQEKERNRVRNLPPPPLSTANFGRRYRTRSLTHSDAPYFNSKRESVPSTPSSSNYQHETPFTGLLGRTLSNLDSRPVVDRGRFYTPRTDRYRSEEIHASPIINHVEMSSNEINQLMESAKWASVLSDSTDNELHDTRVCFADTICLSKLAEMIRNNELQPTSNLSEIERVLEQSTMNITSREQMRQFDGKCYWFHRVILDNHIQFPPGISQDANESRRLAYRHLIDVCTNAGGVKMKMLTNNRVKVVKGQQFDKEDLDINATYISTADLSCLSHCQMVY